MTVWESAHPCLYMCVCKKKTVRGRNSEWEWEKLFDNTTGIAKYSAAVAKTVVTTKELLK